MTFVLDLHFFLELDVDAEAARLVNAVDELGQRHSFLETEIEALDQKYKHPYEFSLKQLNTMLNHTAQLRVDMRDVFGRIYMRNIRNGLANLRNGLKDAYDAAGLTRAWKKVEAQSKKYFVGADQRAVEFVSENWYRRHLDDKETREIVKYEQQMLVLEHMHKFFILHNYKPIPNFAGTLKSLKDQTIKFNELLAAPIDGSFMEVDTEDADAAFVDVDVDTEAEVETEVDAEEEH